MSDAEYRTAKVQLDGAGDRPLGRVEVSAVNGQDGGQRGWGVRSRTALVADDSNKEDARLRVARATAGEPAIDSQIPAAIPRVAPATAVGARSRSSVVMIFAADSLAPVPSIASTAAAPLCVLRAPSHVYSSAARTRFPRCAAIRRGDVDRRGQLHRLAVGQDAVDQPVGEAECTARAAAWARWTAPSGRHQRRSLARKAPGSGGGRRTARGSPR